MKKKKAGMLSREEVLNEITRLSEKKWEATKGGKDTAYLRGAIDALYFVIGEPVILDRESRKEAKK